MARTMPANDLNIPTARVFAPLLQPSRYKGAWGGRGSAKSWFFADNLIERCVMVPGTSWACVRETQKSLKFSAKRLLEARIEHHGLGHLFTVQESQIKTPGNGVIVFEGLQNHTADSIKSLEDFDGAWVEEAQKLSQKSLDILRPTIRKPGSELWFSWNPENESDPVDQLLRGPDVPPDAIVVRANYSDNPWFPDVLQAEMEYDRGRDPDKYSHIWLGQYLQNSDAKVFKNWTIEEFDSDLEAHLRFGADWGYANDPTVLVRGYRTGRKLYIDYEAYQVGCEIIDTPDLFLTVPESEKWPIVADSARPETISHMQKHGFPKILAAKKGAGSVEDGIEFLKTLDIVVHPRCVHTIDELTHYSWKVDKDTGLVLPVLEDKHNHVIDGVRYMCEAERRAAKTVTRPIVRPGRTGRPSSQGWMGA